MAPSLTPAARLPRGPRPYRVLTAILAAGILTAGILTAGLAAQPPAVRPAQQLREAQERFHKLSPEERLNHVIRTGGAEKAFAAVVRDDLDLSIVERGSVESADAIDIVCRAPGQTTVKWAVEEGTTVKKGDRLLELDASALRDQLAAHQTALAQAQAAKRAADAELNLARKETELAVAGSQLSAKIASLELKKDDGQDAERKEILQRKVEQAQRALELARLRGQAAQLKAEANLQATASALELAAKRMKAAEAQLAECVVHAPQAGLVVYCVPGAARNGNPAAGLHVGAPVREGQKLMRVEGLERFTVVTPVHEAAVSQIRLGQAAAVRVDAFVEQEFPGRVKEVSPVASQADWLARDVRVYPVTVEFTAAPSGLRPGMSAQVRLEGAKLPKVLQVPVGAAVRIERETFCYVASGKEIQSRPVTLGARNARTVEVKEGLKEGEKVLRAPGR